MRSIARRAFTSNPLRGYAPLTAYQIDNDHHLDYVVLLNAEIGARLRNSEHVSKDDRRGDIGMVAWAASIRVGS